MPSKKYFTAIVLAIIVVCTLTLNFQSVKHYIPDGLSQNPKKWRPKPRPRPRPTDTSSYLLPQVNSTIIPKVNETIPALPLEYHTTDDADAICSRFSPTYFQDFLDHTASYCHSDSPSTLTCFHRPSGFEGTTDSFCYAQGATLDLHREKFHLDCALRKFSEQEENDGLVPFQRLPWYWYETGPAAIFTTSIDVESSHDARSIDEPNEQGESEPKDVPALTKDAQTPSVGPPKTLLLLKREGEGNPWHSLMEIFSTFMTFDILRMPGGKNGDQPPLFNDTTDADDTQVVILDDRGDGPYFDLWTLFARRKPMRLTELLEDKEIVQNLDSVNLVIPLTGSSNPFWKDDANTEQCTDSQTLDVFSHRVLDFYGVGSPSLRAEGRPMVVTFIWRQETRRLNNQNTLLAELSRRNPHISVQMVDFALIPFSEQIRIAQETDVLVGIHGAGLTHSIFMREGASAVVEVQPRELEHRGFRNIAGMRNLGYFRTHATTILPDNWSAGEPDPIVSMQPNTTHHEGKNKRDTRENHRDRTARKREIENSRDWHFDDIEIEEDRFFEVVETAIKFMYAKGSWTMDIN